MDPVTQQFIADMLPYLAAIEDAARQAKDFAAANLEAGAAVSDMRDKAAAAAAVDGEYGAVLSDVRDKLAEVAADSSLTAAATDELVMIARDARDALIEEAAATRDAAAAEGDLTRKSIEAALAQRQLGDAANNAAGAGGMGGLLKAAIALSPVLLGLAPAVGAAALGFGAFGALAIPTLIQVKNGLTTVDQAQQAVNNATTAAARNTALAHLRNDWAQMPAPIAATVRSIQEFEHQFSQLAASSGVGKAFLGDIQQVMGILRTLLPDIVPLAKAGAAAFHDMLTQIQQMVGAKDTAQFFQQMAQMVGPAVHGITQLALTLSKLLGGALQALAPLMGPALNFINTLATALSNLLANGPGNGILGQLAPLFGQILSALTPLIPPLEQLASSVISALVTVLRPLIPILTQVATIIASALLQALNAATPALRQIAVSIAQLITDAAPLIVLLAKWVVAQAPLITMIIQLAAAILHDLMPILGPLVKDISKIAEVAIPPVIKALGSMMSVFQTVMPYISAVVKAQVEAIRAVLSWFGQLPGMMRGWWNQVQQAVVSAVYNLLTFVRGVPGQILASFGNLGSLLWNAGVSLINGLISGIRAAIPSLQSILSWVTSVIPSWKGPLAADLRLLHANGQAVMQGFLNGLASRRGDLAAMLGGLTSAIPAMAAAGGYGGAGGGSVNVTVPVTVQGQLGAAATLGLQQVVQQAVLDYFTRNRATGLVPYGRS